MSELHNNPAAAGTPEIHDHPVEFNSYVRRCAAVFVAALIALGLMIWTSYLPQEHFGWPAKVTIILVIASINAFIVAGYLMHLLSERKMVYTILAFTVSFVIGLFALTLYAMTDFPNHTVIH
jgi:caa(3)-type oxidase subunit IV